MKEATLDISEARIQFNRLDERLRDEHVVYVTRHNKKMFAVVDLEYLSAALETIEVMSDPELCKQIIDSPEDIKHNRLHDQDDVRKKLDL